MKPLGKPLPCPTFVNLLQLVGPGMAPNVVDQLHGFNEWLLGPGERVVPKLLEHLQQAQTLPSVS